MTFGKNTSPTRLSRQWVYVSCGWSNGLHGCQLMGAGQFWPASHMFENPGLNQRKTSWAETIILKLKSTAVVGYIHVLYGTWLDLL